MEGDPLAGLDFEDLSRARTSGGPRRVTGRIQYNPRALDYRRPPVSNNYQCHGDGKIHGPVSRRDVEQIRSRDRDDVIWSLRESIRNREREIRERGEHGRHRDRVELERAILRSLLKE